MSAPACRECSAPDLLRHFALGDGSGGLLCPICLMHYRDAEWLAEGKEKDHAGSSECAVAADI